MKNVVVAAAAGLAMLVAGTELVRAQDAGEVTIYTKPLIIPWETRETGFAAPTAGDQRLVRRLHYTKLISQYADEYGVPVELAHAVIQVESNFRPTVKGKAGEIGLMQIKPATARMMGYKGTDYGLFDPETNIRFGMKYLAGAHDRGDGKVCGTILKYNAGHGAKKMNPTSRRYCDRVEAILDANDQPAPVQNAVAQDAPAKDAPAKEASVHEASASAVALQATVLNHPTLKYPSAVPVIF